MDFMAITLASSTALFAGLTVYLYRQNKKLSDEVIIVHEEEEEILAKSKVVTNENTKLRSDLKGYANLLDQLNHPAWRRNEDLSLRYCNLAHSKILEDHADDAINPDSMELFGRAKDLARKAISTHQPQTIQKHIVIGGERLFFEITEVPVDDGTVGFATDLTELEDVESKLKQHIDVQNNLMESTTSAIAIYGADTKLEFHNQAFVKLWGLEESLLANHPTYSEVLEFLREHDKLPEQANFKAFKKNNLDLFTNLIEKYEEFYYLPDGRVLRVIIIPHEHGGLLFSYEDVTDYIKLERSYNTLVSVKEHTLDNLFEGIAAFGSDGKLQFFNPVYAELWELEPEFLKERPHISALLEETRFLYKIPDEKWDSYKESIISLTSLRESSMQQLERADSSILEWACIPLPDGALLMNYTDVTDSHRVEESLRAEKEAFRKADKMKTNFLSNVSYEFRSPLTSIIGFSEALQQEYFGKVNNKQKEYLQDILNASDTLNTLIDTIMDIAATDGGYLKIEKTSCDLHKLLNTITRTTEKQFKDRTITLNTKYTKDIGSIAADKERLQQAITILLKNAINRSDDDGNITLHAKRKDDQITISIEHMEKANDNDQQDINFEEFYTANDSKTWDTGLGLVLAKRLIEVHDGSIKLEANAAGKTQVTCQLEG